jgi:selenide,water dikinase
MKAPSPILKRVVLVGGGHSHAFVVKNFGMKPMPGVHVILISKGYDTPYSGMVPGYVAGAYTREECYIDLAKLARFGKAELVQGEVVGIDIQKKLIHLADGRPPITYDVVSIDIGSCPQPMDFSDSAIPVTRVKPIDGFGDRWNVLVQRVLGTEAPFTFAVVGGGAGGVELVLSMQARLRKELARVGRPVELVTAVLVTHTPAVLPSHNATVQRKFARLLAERGVKVYLGRHVTAVRGRFIVSDAGEDIEADEVIWCTQASTQEWLRTTGLELHNGFIAVDDHLQSVNAPDVFAAGDVALMVNHPRPRAGVFAVRQGPPLAANIRHWLVGEPLEVHIPQTEFLGLISTGLPWCVASKGPMALEGEWLWDLKDWIDRKWMASYTTALPRMAEAREDLSPVAIAAGPSALEALAHAAMRCGGCGSKVGASVLSRVLARLELPPARPEVLVGLDHPDDCAIVRLPDSASGLAAVHTVDFFRSFITDPFVFGQIAANHALSDCHAMCADAVSALAVAVIPFAVEDKMEQILLQVCVCVCWGGGGSWVVVV